MGNWRRRRGNNQYNQHEIMQEHGTLWNSGKPPLAVWKRAVPTWEKNFCRNIGSIPWGKVLEVKKSMEFYENVVQWNDSAGEEAFNNAKARFWAEINDLPCNISLPDPDMYIDDIDWDAEVNIELILDLERDTEAVREKTEDEHAMVLDGSYLRDHYPLGYGIGWGEAEGIDEHFDVVEPAGNYQPEGNGKANSKNPGGGEWGNGQWRRQRKSWKAQRDDRRWKNRGRFPNHSTGRPVSDRVMKQSIH